MKAIEWLLIQGSAVNPQKSLSLRYYCGVYNTKGEILVLRI